MIKSYKIVYLFFKNYSRNLKDKLHRKLDIFQLQIESPLRPCVEKNKNANQEMFCVHYNNIHLLWELENNTEIHYDNTKILDSIFIISSTS